MEVFELPPAWRLERSAQTRARRTLGFVPTMGALHEGHLSLVRRSREENDRTLVSIFVNPTQFDESVDLASYPRTLDADLAALRQAGTDYVLLPREPDLYADGYRYKVTEHGLSTRLEGAQRPGHFEGVLTVVLKLLQIAGADRAYFGEKDWQQLEMVRGLVDAFFIPTAIVGCPTIREADGLALSSRNGRLQPPDRRRAPAFYQILSSARTAEEAARELGARGFEVDYVTDVDDVTMARGPSNGAGRRLAAVRLGGIRLIDNVAITSSGSSGSGGSVDPRELP